MTDAEGKSVPLGRFAALGEHGLNEVDLAPGKEIEVYKLKLELRPESESGNKGGRTLYGTGKFQIQYEQVVGKSSGGPDPDPDRTLSKLATGKLEIEIKSEPPPAVTEKN